MSSIDKKGIIRYAHRGKPALTDVLNVLRRIQELQNLPEMSKYYSLQYPVVVPTVTQKEK